MHELSIARSLIELATDRLDSAGWNAVAERVSVVKVRIGELSGVVPEALSGAFEMAAVGSALEGATLEIDPVGLIVWCPECEVERGLSSTQERRCPVCHAPAPRVVRGMELELVSIEVVDATTNRGSPAANSEAQ